ncbi:hypothetical protein LTS18_009461, partial [Coniosporium uncinatum]
MSSNEATGAYGAVGYGHLAVPLGFLVLVTGASGFLGSNIVDQLLSIGYKVRGTMRSRERNSWILSLFHARYGKNAFELVEVPEMAADGPFDDAVR